MKKYTCSACGSGDFIEKNNQKVCKYCGSVFVMEQSDFGARQSEISLSSDVDRLLEKCRKDPKNAAKYANLILDIDPGNEEAYKYL